MANPVGRAERVALSVGEVTGSVGDLVTTLPIVVALAALTEVSLPHVLLVFGAFQIVWGVAYGLPLSVEPMKALAALAIAGSLTYAELAVAGVVLGVVLTALGGAKVLGAVERWIGEPVVRGVQLAVALLLLRTGAALALDDLVLAVGGGAVAAAAIALGHKRASALAVLGVGVVVAVVSAGLPAPSVPGLPPTPDLGAGLTFGALDGAVAQLAMTIGNAAIATSLLVSDLFEARVSADRLSRNMGLMNLASIPLGGIPMCHGCDGVAGAHAFGARTGGANVIQGAGFVAIVPFAGAAFVAAFPIPVLGVLLGIVAIELSRSALGTESLGLTVLVGVLGAAVNVAAGLLVGAAVYQLLLRRERR
ncbi:putative sulfate/molybdate transporter [Halegenticoccus tardaugens]|uniref:putative sulfate/molybdate transporter n=1 Tax=Halegenticoccus tardaugens TaxID=2071624 RepID=UPI00100BCCD2|nr:putative sulfate/molybdate transporter [Halegenticoccus tardaugens]